MTRLTPTSIHLPPDLVKALDRKAKALRISRNQLVIRAIERELNEASDCSPGFFERLMEHDDDLADAVDAMLEAIKRNRTSKGPPRL
jgi:predicted transcriptional regulator